MSDSNRDNQPNKRLKTGDDSESDYKNKLIKLIKNNESVITYKSIQSKCDYMQNFKRVFHDNSETIYVKCDKCSILLKYVSTLGTSGVKRHSCQEVSETNVQKIDRYFYKSTNNESKLKSEL